MVIFQNHSDAVTAAYIAAGVSILVTCITILATRFANRRTRKGNAELEALKQKLELAKEYRKRKIDHIGILLNFIYNIRVACQTLLHDYSDLHVEELMQKVKDFESYYRGNADRTNALNVEFRSYAHDTIKYYQAVSQDYKFKDRYQDRDVRGHIKHSVNDLFVHSKAYEAMLRNRSEEELNDLLS